MSSFASSTATRSRSPEPQSPRGAASPITWYFTWESTFVPLLANLNGCTFEEMRIAIDRFQRWAAENGIYIPAPEDEDRLREIEVEMARMKTWL